MSEHSAVSLPDFIVDHVGVGIFAVSRDMRVLRWNRFMELHSRLKPEQVVGQYLFDRFPELPRRWLEKKIITVFALKTFAFTSWEQRPYLFRFPHDRPVTGGIDFMQQNCTFMPVTDAQREVQAVCVTLFDVTDMGIVQRRLEDAMTALKESASRDGLTGIYNRRYLEERLSQEFARYKRYGSNLSILLFDLDHFKQVNDQHGHLAGDAVLRATATRITEVVRTMDVFARYGGEEFMLILPETSLGAAMLVAEKVRRLISDQPVDIGNAQLQITVSVGACAAHTGLSSYEALIRGADSALYRAKEQGRNCCVRSDLPA